ncbi:MAG: hypothetical protein IC227_10700 [Enterococcus lacertideformus]|uniref:Uncharacterized protein n=1 Tax=Enterococcus lacertideformus TaxID=2771493 RepID=A0A931FDA0_9ENTE|nr:hypothetical protein [Enterococcus lacertideformus]
MTDLTLGLENKEQAQSVLLITNGKNLSESVELTTLSKEKSIYNFSFFGSAGGNITLENLVVPIKPVYTMNLHFKVNKEK